MAADSSHALRYKGDYGYGIPFRYLSFPCFLYVKAMRQLPDLVNISKMLSASCVQMSYSLIFTDSVSLLLQWVLADRTRRRPLTPYTSLYVKNKKPVGPRSAVARPNRRKHCQLERTSAL